MNLSWKVNNLTGTVPFTPGACHITVHVPEGRLETVEAHIDVPIAAKMFFNGFQTWTHCPEYSSSDRIRGLHRIPGFAVRRFSLDRYGDYHFVDYPYKAGILHGISYCYFRDKEHYRLFASLDENPGYTCFSYDCAAQILTVTRDCRGLLTDIGASEEFHAFDLFYAEGSEDEVFDAWFDALGIHNNPPRIKGYSSWYNHYQDISESGIYDDLNGASKLFEAGDLFQIDDGWEPFVGDWEATDPAKFPHGLKPIADEVHARGLKAGLWLAPFICEEKSALRREHPDWLLTHDGRPWKAGCNWSGFFSLDIDNPEVIVYLEKVFSRVFDEWGFDLVKLDFLYAAAPFGTPASGSGDAIRETRAARMIRAMKLLRRLCRDRLILGCGVPVMPAFGLVDYCRISCDVSLDWNDKPYMRIIHRERVSTKQAIDNTVFRHALDGRAHGNDPDVFFLRDTNIRLTAAEKTYLAAINSLYGTVFLTSDNLNAYTDSAADEYRRCVSLKNAAGIHIDRDTLEISYTLNGQRITLPYPRRR